MTIEPCRRCGKVECAEEAERSFEIAEVLDAAEPREVGVPLPEPAITAPFQDWAIEAIKPEPGQTVVLTLDRMPEPHVLEAVGDQLKQAFPDNRCVVVEEGTSLSVKDGTSWDDLLYLAEKYLGSCTERDAALERAAELEADQLEEGAR